MQLKRWEFLGQILMTFYLFKGIDYRHPAFGGGFGPGYQVRYGYDLVGDKYNSRDPNSRQQGETPLDSCLNGNGKCGVLVSRRKYDR